MYPLPFNEEDEASLHTGGNTATPRGVVNAIGEILVGSPGLGTEIGELE